MRTGRSFEFVYSNAILLKLDQLSSGVNLYVYLKVIFPQTSKKAIYACSSINTTKCQILPFDICKRLKIFS